MDEPEGREYYLSRKSEILAIFDAHARAWRPFLISLYGDEFADTVLMEAREQHEALIPEIPYIGGDENPMTRHLVGSTTSLALYKAMKTRGKTARETGKVIYDAVVESVSQLPPRPAKELSAEYIAKGKQQAQKSQRKEATR